MNTLVYQLAAWYLATSCKLPDDADPNVRNVKFLDLNLNPQAEICEDLRSYACGNSFNNVPFEKIPPEGINWMRVRSEHVDLKLLDMLNGETSTSAVVKKAGSVFQNCTTEKISRTNTFDTINFELSRLGFNSIKVSSTPENFDHTAALAQLLKISTIYNNFFMMRIEVIEDPINPGKYVPFIITNSPHHAKINDNYAKNVYSMMKIEFTKEIEDAATFIRNMQEITSNANVQPMAEWSRKNLNFLEFKTNDCFLAGNKGEQCLWKFEWEKFFGNLFGSLWKKSEIDKSEFFVYVTNLNTLMRAISLLQKTEESTVARALWLLAVQFASPLGSQPLQTVYKEGVEDPIEILELSKEEQCLAIVKDLFRPLVAHTLVQNLTDDDESELNEIQNLVKEELTQLVRNAEWLSDSARGYLVPKIENMKIHIPYIDAPRQENDLIDDYPNIQINPELFYKTYTNMLVEKRNKLFARIFDATNESRLEYQPPMSLYPNQPNQITYYPLLNEIEIPVFTIGYPNYYGPQFRALNVGGFGFQLARQMARAVDSANIKFNGDGKMEYGKWQTKDQTNYENRVDPIKEVFLNEMPKWSKSNADQNEMIIDNIGLTVGFRVIKNIYPNPDETHGDGDSSNRNTIEKHNAHELFTLGVAMTMCRTAGNAESSRYIDFPNRLNEVFKRSADFIKTWNCKDSAMDGRDKCAVFP